MTHSEILDASILIVDDQEPNVILLTALLAEAGYTRVASTMNPHEVCALHRKHRYDLILLDLQMPGLDGFHVMEGLKTNIVDGYLPVIVLTAQPGHKVRALQAGAKDFISKPFDLVEVKTRIRNMLEVRLLYRRLEDFNTVLETDRRGAHRRAARKRGALSKPDRARLRLVLGAGRGRKLHAGFRPGAGNARDPGADPRRRNQRRRGAVAGTRRSATRCARRSPPGSRSWTSFSAAQNADGSRQKFQVSGEPMFNQACHFIGYRGIGVELFA